MNYKRFNELNVCLDPHLTVLSGMNGAGKSTLLNAMTIVMSWVIARLRNENGVGRYINPIEICNGNSDACITACFADDVQVTIPNKAVPGLSKKFVFDIAGLKPYLIEKRTELITSDRATLPVMAFYGVKRAVLDIPILTRHKEYNIFDSYDGALEGAVNFRSFFTWFRACEDWENEKNARSQDATCIEHPGLKAFREAMSIVMPGYDNLKIFRHPLRMMIRKGDQNLNIEQLSDGEKIYIALIGDLCHRLSLANPHGNPLEGEGIIMIDEVDLHLHPQWQSRIAMQLPKIFPNLQFVVTTHSPHVINSVPDRCVRMLTDDGNIENAPYAYGMPSEVILEDVMNLKTDVPREVAVVIDSFTKAYSHRNIENVKACIIQLEEMVPRHPDLPRMRKLAERLQR